MRGEVVSWTGRVLALVVLALVVAVVALVMILPGDPAAECLDRGGTWVFQDQRCYGAVSEGSGRVS